MSTVAGNVSIANNLWTGDGGQTLLGQKFNDILHAIHNNTRMRGGEGKDHFHVNMTPKSAVTGTKILDFNASQSDRLVLDGITDFNANKITIAANGNDYDVSYDGKLVANVNLQYTNAAGQVLDWNPDLEQAKAAITKMIRAGQAEAKSDYLYGTNTAQIFSPEYRRKLNVVDFDRKQDDFGLPETAEKYQLDTYPDLAKVSIVSDTYESYILLKIGEDEIMTVRLKAGSTPQDLEDTKLLIEQGLGLAF